MPEHFPRNTVMATYWCKKCGKQTPHRVDGVKRGPCLVCLEKKQPAKEKKPKLEQAMLFDEPIVPDRRFD